MLCFERYWKFAGRTFSLLLFLILFPLQSTCFPNFAYTSVLIFQEAGTLGNVFDIRRHTLRIIWDLIKISHINILFHQNWTYDTKLEANNEVVKSNLKQLITEASIVQSILLLTKWYQNITEFTSHKAAHFKSA